MNRWRTAAFLVLLLLAPAMSSASQVGEVSLTSLTTGAASYDPGQDVQITATAENVADEPQAGLTAELSILWAESRNESADHTTVYTTQKTFDLPPEGSETLEFTWPVPAQAAAGDYRVFLEVLNENGQPQAVRSAWFTVNDTGQTSRAVTISGIQFQQGATTAAGTYGMHVTRNKSMDITVLLNNTGESDLAPTVAAAFQFTYDRDRVAKTVSTTTTIPAGAGRVVTLTTTPPAVPTTYTPRITVKEEGTLIASRTGRIVVEGDSARILEVSPSQSVYREGEAIKMAINVIGPADYSGTLNDVSLEFAVGSPDGMVLSGERTVDIPASTKTITVSGPAPRDLADYNVSVTLRKDGAVLDRWETTYDEGELPTSRFPTASSILGVIIVLVLAGIGWWYYREQ